MKDRAYYREWARRKRARRWAQEAQTRRTCPKRFGKYGECGGLIEADVFPGGHIKLVCRRCERFQAGLCLDCPARVKGQVRKAWRCSRCRHKASLQAAAKYRENNRALVNRKARLRARKNRQRNADYKRLWRQANPEKVRAQKRRYALRQPAAVYEYQRTYRLARREDWWPRPAERHCVTCPNLVRGRVKKCAVCKESLKQSAQRWLGWAA